MGWVDSRVGLGWVGLGSVRSRFFSFLMGWLGSWVRNYVPDNLIMINIEK